MTKQEILGHLAIIVGLGVLGLACAESFSGLPISMPRSWYVDRALWVIVAIGMIPFGGCLLLNAQSDSGDWKPTLAGPRFQWLRLYTRENCPLCEEASELLHAHQAWLPEIEEIDIAADPELTARFGEWIPVVEIDGKIRFKGRIHPVLLHRLIEASPPRQ